MCFLPSLSGSQKYGQEKDQSVSNKVYDSDCGCCSEELESFQKWYTLNRCQLDLLKLWINIVDLENNCNTLSSVKLFPAGKSLEAEAQIGSVIHNK